MQTMRSFMLAFTCLLLSCQALQGDWSAPTDITPIGDFSSSPKLAVAGNGGAVAVFQNFNTGAIQGAVTSCGNNWTPTADLVVSAQAFDPIVAIDDDGNAVAIWRASSGGDTILQGATLAAGSLIWVSTTDLSSTGQAVAHDIAMNANGEAVAVWSDTPGGIVLAATLASGSGVWVPATAPLSQPLQPGFNPQVAIDPSGNAVAVWQTNGPGAVIRGSLLAAGSSTWIPTTDLTSADFSEIPQVAVDAAGNAVAVWRTINGALNEAIHAARLPFGSTVWIPTGDVAPFSVTLVTDQQVAMNLAGAAIASWFEFSGGNTSVRAAILPIGSNTWTPTDLLLPDTSFARIAIDPAGNAVAAWMNSSNVPGIIQTATLISGSVNWADFVDLSSLESFEASIGIDNFGSSVAVWGAFDDVSNIGQAAVNLAINPLVSTVVANPTSVPADGMTPSTITVTLTDCAGVPFVGHAVTLTALNGSSVISPPSGLSDALGQVTFTVTDAVAEIVTYQARDTTAGITIIQTATVQFEAGLLPPSNFHGKILPDPCHRCLRLHLLTWCPSPDPTVVGYRIYENGQVIAQTGKKGPFVALIPNRQPDVSYTYRLVAFNAAGEESTPLIITSPARPQSSSCEDSSRCCR